jgi:hypothetical protein
LTTEAAAAAPGGVTSTEAAAAASAVATPPPAAETTAATQAAPAPGETLLAGDAAKPAEGAEAQATKAAGETAPDYATLKMPDGFDAADPLLEAFKGVAGEHKVSPEVAQAMIDKVLPGLTSQIQALRDEPIRLASARLQEWETAVQADPEIGGAKLAEVKTNVARAMAQFGNPDEIRAALNETGAGSNPVLIKWLNKLSAAVGEGKAVTGNPALPKAGPAQRMYEKSLSQVAG